MLLAGASAQCNPSESLIFAEPRHCSLSEAFLAMLEGFGRSHPAEAHEAAVWGGLVCELQGGIILKGVSWL